MSGVVQEVGMGVSQFVKGQSVVLMPLQPEYEFQDCEHGKRQRVIENGFMNSKAIFSAPSSYLYPLPASVSLQSARYLAALATAYHALLRTSPFRSLDNVLIVSSSCISLCLVRLLSLQNALQIIVVEQNPILKRLAVQFGATHVLDPGDIDISESVRLLTDDMGADIVFQISDQCDYEPTNDIASSTSMLKRIRARNAANSAISACRTRGTIVNIAPREMYEGRKSKFRNELMMHEVQYMGSAGYDFASLKAAVGLMERGDVKFDGSSLA
ncbi:hypothetical protein EIK77_001354 [Talaromyces pinophilus]|nr:hypothetical protein EIK77_001354 [Talaromyces pinophilus]PCH01112.1 hypothetical protein PENOC_049800 [Penicillium occitanis (nom. inval.)]